MKFNNCLYDLFFYNLTFIRNSKLITEQQKDEFIDRLDSIQYSYTDATTDREVNLFAFENSDITIFSSIVIELFNNKDQLNMMHWVKNNNTNLFVSSGEGWADSLMFDTIHRLIEIYQLTENIYFENNSINLSSMYDQYCKSRNISPIINCLFIRNYFNHPNFVMNDHPQYVKYDVEDSPVETKKLFCCFNLRPRAHRAGLIALLHYYDLLDDGYVSTPFYWKAEKSSYNKNKDWYTFSTMVYEQLGNLGNYRQIEKKLGTLKDVYPLRIDDRKQYSSEDVLISSKELYYKRKDSLFEIIPETLYYGPHYFTEKTFQPIFVGIPFLMVNGVDSFKSLRSVLKYQTFDPYIDESYDLEENGARRLVRIVEELYRLRKLRQSSPQEFYQMYNHILVRAKYNQEHFLNLKK